MLGSRPEQPHLPSGIYVPRSQTMAAQRFDELLLDLYRCPTEISRWPDVLDQVRRGTGARSAVIQILETDTECASSYWTLRDSESEAARERHERVMGDAVNPRMQTSLHRRSLPADRIHRDDHFFAPGDPARAELRERLAELNLGHFMSVGTALSERQRLVLVLHRDLADRHDFSPDDQAFALRLLPHLHQSVQSALRFEAERERTQSLEGAVDRLRCALVLTTPDGSVRWANRAARDIFARRDRLWVQAEQLRTAWPHETANLRRLIARVSADGKSARPLAEHFFVLGRSEQGHPLQIMIQPVTTDSGRHVDRRDSRNVMLVLSDPCTAPDLPAEILEALFGLSPAEARLAAALCRGVTLGEYAHERGVTIGTARFQLKQVLAKTRARRQGNLIQQLCSSAIAQSVLAIEQ
jgi:DNA-binding CsgD family transcriptional regulator/PAS domain-containing protein